MADKKSAVFGIYPSVAEAADHQSSKDFAHEKHTKAPEGTTTGAAAGGTIGGTLGLLAGIGALAITGVGEHSRVRPAYGSLTAL
jgi:hypothetical protein